MEDKRAKSPILYTNVTINLVQCVTDLENVHNINSAETRTVAKAMNATLK